MNTAIIIVTALLLAPLLIPWNKYLLIYSLVTWFLLWGVFFMLSFKESSLSVQGTINNNIVNASAIVGLVIVVFSISMALRTIIHFVIVNKCIKNHENDVQNT